MMETVELLAPAGTPESLDAAIGEGADAVYLGLKSFNARMRSSNFAYSQFESATRSLHRMGRKIYVTVNTVFEQREADRMYQFLKYLASVGPDGIIVQDFGVARMARECFPSLKVHASTQMNIASARAANVLSKAGVSRVVLSRELNLQEIASVRESCSVELEVFVHGALCVSESGLCLFSSYLGGKSANRGMCAQACRRRFSPGRPEDSAFGEAEGEGGYFFSPADLQLIADVPDLIEAGVSSLKIEGRMKSAEYVGTVVSAYRFLLDSYPEDRDRAVAGALDILKKDFARAKTRYHFAGSDPSGWLNPAQPGGTGIALGAVERVRGAPGGGLRGFLKVGVQDVAPGDSLRFHRADDSDRKSLKIDAVEPESGGVWVPLPEGFGTGDPVYMIQRRSGVKRYGRVIAQDLSAFRRQPGRDSAPDLPQKASADAAASAYPEGLYAQVSRVEDLFVLQSHRPVRALLQLNRTIAGDIATLSKPLPFRKDELVFVLDPFFPQGDDPWLCETVEGLLDAGYRNFVVNNLGHLSLFRSRDVRLAAGPYLYAFNRWSLDFLASFGLWQVFSPLENNRQNLERSVDEVRRRDVVVPVFAYPALFRIRADLSTLYDFSFFSDSRGDSFELIAGPDLSVVVPEEPYSITDKVPFLKSSGFSRFLLDFSGPKLSKRQYKVVMEAAAEGLVLPGTRRFNYKDGFFNVDGSSSSASSPGRRSGPGPGDGQPRQASVRGGARRDPDVPAGGRGGKRPEGNGGANSPRSPGGRGRAKRRGGPRR